jgi:hypothetical protein
MRTRGEARIFLQVVDLEDIRGSQLGLPDADAERLVPMARSDWLTSRGTNTHQGVFISSKKVPYGVGLTLMSRPRTDGGSFLSPPHIFRGSFLFYFRHSHFDQFRQFVDRSRWSDRSSS